jgi:drug/metabolite transporter (DMT)-like permease
MNIKEWFWVIILGAGWGSSFFFNEILLREVGPLTVAWGRIALGALGCWIYVFATGRAWRFPPIILLQFAFLGLVNFAFPFAIYPLSQEVISSGAAGIINALTPVMVVIVSHFWRNSERATALKSIGVLLGFAGIIVMALPALQAGEKSEFWGLMIALLAPVSYAIAVNFVRRFREIDSATISALALTFGTIMLTPLMLAREGIPVITQIETWIAFGVIGLVLTAASFIVMFWLMARVGGTNASIVTFIAPVSAVLLGVVFLGEHVSMPQIFGASCILFALLVIDGRLFRRLASRTSA